MQGEVGSRPGLLVLYAGLCITAGSSGGGEMGRGAAMAADLTADAAATGGQARGAAGQGRAGQADSLVDAIGILARIAALGAAGLHDGGLGGGQGADGGALAVVKQGAAAAVEGRRAGGGVGCELGGGGQPSAL